MHIWERRANETNPAYEAFKVYLTLEERSYPRVATAVSKSLTLIKRWAKAHDWRARADAWDNELSRKALEKASAEFASMVERQINIGRMLQSRGANAIQRMDFSNLPPKFLPALVEMTKAGVNMERSARELQRAKPQENLFVETLTKLWERGGADD